MFTKPENWRRIVPRPSFDLDVRSEVASRIIRKNESCFSYLEGQCRKNQKCCLFNWSGQHNTDKNLQGKNHVV